MFTIIIVFCCSFNGKLFSGDDRAGISKSHVLKKKNKLFSNFTFTTVYQIENGNAAARFVLGDGNGKEEKVYLTLLLCFI
jgi:hypothetical protein